MNPLVNNPLAGKKKPVQEEAAIAKALCLETGVMLFFGLIAGWAYGVHSGLSFSFGALSYLLPYALVFIIFFYQFSGWVKRTVDQLNLYSESGEKELKKSKRKVAGGFIIAELLKNGLTLAGLGAIALWYSDANWSMVLIGFAAAIILNWAALWLTLRRLP